MDAQPSARSERPAWFDAEVLKYRPTLLNLGYALSRKRSEAEDLVSDTVIRAMMNWDRFEQGTNMKAWLCTILRNQFYNSHRDRLRELDYSGKAFHRAEFEAQQEWSIYHREVMTIIAFLPNWAFEALHLTGDGVSYRQQSNIMGMAEGTAKSRVSRARELLQQRLNEVVNGGGIPKEAIRVVSDQVVRSLGPKHKMPKWVHLTPDGCR